MPQNTYADTLRALASAWEANMALIEKHDSVALEPLMEFFLDLPEYAVERNPGEPSDGVYTFNEWLSESEVKVDVVDVLTCVMPDGKTAVWVPGDQKWFLEEEAEDESEERY